MAGKHRDADGGLKFVEITVLAYGNQHIICYNQNYPKLTNLDSW